MVAKYDWESVKTDFLNKTYKTLKQLAEAHKIPYQQVKNKVKRYNNIVTKLEEKVIDKIAAKKVKVLEERVKLGDKFMELADYHADHVVVKTAFDVTKFAETGVKLQNSGLGIDDESNKPGVTIIFQALTNGQIRRPAIKAEEITDGSNNLLHSKPETE